VETYDGRHGWELNWPKQRLVHTVGKAEQALRCGAEFLPLFVDYRQRGFTATLLGAQELLGEHLVAVRIDQPGCSSATYYFDPASYRLRMTKLTIPIHARGASKEAVSVHKAFKTVAGVQWPALSEEIDLATGAVLGGGEWTSIEANTLDDPAIFAAPPVHPEGITAVVLDMLATTARGKPTVDVMSVYDRFRASTEGRQADVFYDLNWLGFELLKADDYPNAIAVLQRLVEENPSAASAYDSLGDAYAQQGDHAHAIAAYGQALALDASRMQTREKRRQLDP